MKYRVRWEIDVDADNPVDAARQALTMQRDSSSTATVFTVYESDSEHGQVVDLIQRIRMGHK